MLHEDRFFPAEPGVRALARSLFATISDAPLICPHGHTDPAWFAQNPAFPDPVQLLVVPDHYILRMLVSQGITLDALGVPRTDGTVAERDSRKIWRLFCENYYLFRATPVQHWMDFTLSTLFDVTEPLSVATADESYDKIAEALATPDLRPRALYERFGIEVIATTDGCLDDLAHHKAIREDAWAGRVVPTYRPDAVTNPDHAGFHDNLRQLGEMTGEDTETWAGLMRAHRARRAHFIAHGATATDHGHPSATTCDLSAADCAQLLDAVLSGTANDTQKEAFRGQMLTEMARMSIEDGLVMQLHPGSVRNHSHAMFDRYGADKGFDIPGRTNYVDALRPLLNAHGLDPRLNIILFTLDESSYGRELAPLAGVYPSLKLGPAWWFFDSPDGMRRFREMTTETAGFYNTVGFNDDTRALPSIAARHDMARRVDCAYLARLVAEHRLTEEAAAEVAMDLAYHLPKRAYRLEQAT